MLQCISLFSGSGGNSVFVREENTRLLIDAGVSFRRLLAALCEIGEEIDALDGVFFTHEHSDHIAALPMLLKKTRLPFYLDARCAEGAYDTLLAKDPSLAAEFVRRVRTVCAGEEYELGSLVLSPFSIPHDSAACLGAVFYSENGEKLLGVATDIGEMTAEARRALVGARHVILESNHDPEMLENGPYPPYLKERIKSEFGHLSNPDCAAFLALLAPHGLEKALLFHLSSDNNTPALALSSAREALDQVGSACTVQCAAPDLRVPLI